MTSSSVLLFIVLAVLVASFSFLVRAEGGFGELPRLLQRGLDYLGVPLDVSELLSRNEPQPDTMFSVPAAFTSGNSRYSRGTCTTDADCVPAGCSGEVCSDDPDVVTTCGFSDDFPNAQGYSCGCVQGVCGWR